MCCCRLIEMVTVVRSTNSCMNSRAGTFLSIYIEITRFRDLVPMASLLMVSPGLGQTVLLAMGSYKNLIKVTIGNSETIWKTRIAVVSALVGTCRCFAARGKRSVRHLDIRRAMELVHRGMRMKCAQMEVFSIDVTRSFFKTHGRLRIDPNG